MKAARAYPITAHTTDVRIEQVEIPAPGPGEVLVQITAAGVTRLDHSVAAGGPSTMGLLPLTLGSEGAGLVVADPGGRWPAGTRVMFFAGAGGVTADGTMAEFAVVPVRNLAVIPVNVSDEVAAAVPIAYLTALLALRTGVFEPGTCVFAPGIGGSVGNATVQLARALGAAAVAGGVGTTAKAAAIRAAPWAWGVQVVDLEQDRLRDGLGDGFAAGIDLAVDGVGGAVTAQIATAMAPGGHLILVGCPGGRSTRLPLGEVIGRRATLHGFSLHAVPSARMRAAWAEIVELLATARISPVIDSIYPLEAVAEALRHLVEDRPVGKVVITGLSTTR
ncbi:zinc-binding alcohol dehydrogenase family protein [Actinoallomurus purpureus]|uniref:quinone oxidoreductase family protein n=1 Tax=Actinoallomurus purpureus TaxID=478114 RepID=UPI0020920328|nr:zinc-binding alcohol dehydrogenase family protein [Actinoallomurus purpureus]MCO6009437.1 zinc-binding alcohol dehydrogenase family protein [Actinoallomurus purpureus]